MTIAIYLHLSLALVASVCALVIFYNPKGSSLHRWLGRIFTLTLLTSTLATFWIYDDNGYSFIHLLSIMTLYWLTFGFLNARQKKSKMWQVKHANHMLSACIAIISAGSGVVTRHFVFPGDTNAGLIVTLVVVIICVFPTRHYLKQLPYKQ